MTEVYTFTSVPSGKPFYMVLAYITGFRPSNNGSTTFVYLAGEEAGIEVKESCETIRKLFIVRP